MDKKRGTKRRRRSERAAPSKPVHTSEVISVRVGQDGAKARQTRGEQFRATMLALARTLPTVPGSLTFFEAPPDRADSAAPSPPDGWAGDLLSWLDHCAATGWGEDFLAWAAKLRASRQDNPPIATGEKMEPAAPPQPDTRTRREKLEVLLAFSHVIGASRSELSLDNFAITHGGRNPNYPEGKALGLTDEEPFPPFHECHPDLYLETVAEFLRSEPSIKRHSNPGGRFKRRLKAASKRSVDGKLLAKDLLVCALEALGVSPSAAHNLLRRLPNDEAEIARRRHLGNFVAERLHHWLSPWPPGDDRKPDAYRVKATELLQAYRGWCKEDPARIEGAEPYTDREFFLAIREHVGGVIAKHTKSGTVYYGIELRPVVAPR
ncbi:MAG: hypothetical protein ABSF35_10715 [Polyangia bacterium]